MIAPRAIIDHVALRHNFDQVRRHAPSSKVWAVIKADAYGHGMARAAESLKDADGFAVARVAEAVALRGTDARTPILVLSGAHTRDELEAALHHGLELALHSQGQLELLEGADVGRPLRAWLKVDTGMHRLGLHPAEVPAALERLSAAALQPRPGLMTHLANADDPADPLTAQQCARLHALARHDQPLNIGNSAGILAFPSARTDWVRPGIMLYGSTPFSGPDAEAGGAKSARALGLKPVMTFKTRLISVRHLRRGDRIGYGGTYSCPQDMRVGVAAVGYGDGYPRHAPSGTPVLVGNRTAPLVGRVSMDSISIDLRGVPDAFPGDEVTLWGAGLPAEEIAAHAGTISYELFCGIAGRVRKEHIGS
jgi:alanine racemase